MSRQIKSSYFFCTISRDLLSTVSTDLLKDFSKELLKEVSKEEPNLKIFI